MHFVALWPHSTNVQGLVWKMIKALCGISCSWSLLECGEIRPPAIEHFKVGWVPCSDGYTHFASYGSGYSLKCHIKNFSHDNFLLSIHRKPSLTLCSNAHQWTLHSAYTHVHAYKCPTTNCEHIFISTKEHSVVWGLPYHIKHIHKIIIHISIGKHSTQDRVHPHTHKRSNLHV